MANWATPTQGPSQSGWGAYRPGSPAGGVNPNGQYGAYQPGAVYGTPGSPQYQFNGGTGPGGGQGYGTWQAMGQRDGRGNGMPTVAAPAPTPQPSGPSQGGGINVQTSVQPQQVYNGRDTRSAQNLAMAQGSLPLPWLLQQFARPGMSTDSPAMVGNALPQVAQARLGGWQQHQAIPFQDATMNAQSLLSGQQAREGEALGLSGALANVNAADRRYQAQNASSIMNLLSSFM